MLFRSFIKDVLKRGQLGYPSSPILGSKTLPGSPRFIAEQERIARRSLKEAQGGYPSSPILGSTTLPGSPRFVIAQQRAKATAEKLAIAQERSANKESARLLKESQKGYPSSPVAGTPAMPGSPRFLAAQEKSRAAAERAIRAQERAASIAEKIANNEAAKALRESQKGYPSSPILGTTAMPGSPKFIAAQERSRIAAERRARLEQSAQDRAIKIQQQIADRAQREADKALREAQKGYPSSPILGTPTMIGSPRYLAARQRRAGSSTSGYPS